jgi:hypothetical protein
MPLTSDQIDELSLELEYTADNVGAKAAENDQLEKKINEIEAAVNEHIHSSNSQSPPELKTLFYKLGLWYVYHKRKPAEAIQYLSFYKNVCSKNEYAHACNLLGHAHTIDGAYQNTEFFDEALHVCENALNGKEALSAEETTKLEFEKAFATKYIGLFYHRNGAHDKAQGYFLESMATYEKVAKRPNIHWAECVHLYAVSLTKQKKFTEALTSLEQAYREESEYVQSSGPHFMLYVTMQSISDTKRQLAESLRKDQPLQAEKLLLEANQVLEEAYVGQVKFFKADNPDIAKTLQFLGDVNLSLCKYKRAADYYAQTLTIKVKLFGNKHGMVDFTRKSITNLLIASQHYFDFDWNDDEKLEKAGKKLKAVEDVIQCILKIRNDLDDDALEQLALLSLTISTSYNHIDRDPVRALDHQLLAHEIFTKALPKSCTKISYVLLLAHIAFSLQQILFKGKSDQVIFNASQIHEIASANNLFSNVYLNDKMLNGFDNDDIYYLANHVIKLSRIQLDQLGPGLETVKAMAFIGCVDALLKYENAQLDLAVDLLRISRKLYEGYGLQHDGNQYARMMNRYLQLLSEQKNMVEAETVSKDLIGYWSSRRGAEKNPFAGRFYNTYGKVLFSQGKIEEALKAFKIAVNILKHAEGGQSNDIKTVQQKIDEIQGQLKPPVSVTTFSLMPPVKPETMPLNKAENVFNRNLGNH